MLWWEQPSLWTALFQRDIKCHSLIISFFAFPLVFSISSHPHHSPAHTHTRTKYNASPTLHVPLSHGPRDNLRKICRPLNEIGPARKSEVPRPSISPCQQTPTPTFSKIKGTINREPSLGRKSSVTSTGIYSSLVAYPSIKNNVKPTTKEPSIHQPLLPAPPSTTATKISNRGGQWKDTNMHASVQEKKWAIVHRRWAPL